MKGNGVVLKEELSIIIYDKAFATKAILMIA